MIKLPKPDDTRAHPRNRRPWAVSDTHACVTAGTWAVVAPREQVPPGVELAPADGCEDVPEAILQCPEPTRKLDLPALRRLAQAARRAAQERARASFSDLRRAGQRVTRDAKAQLKRESICQFLLGLPHEQEAPYSLPGPAVNPAVLLEALACLPAGVKRVLAQGHDDSTGPVGIGGWLLVVPSLSIRVFVARIDAACSTVYPVGSTTPADLTNQALDHAAQ